MGTIASQITSLTIVYSTVYSDAGQRKYQSSASLAVVRGIHRGPMNSPHKMASNAENASIGWRYHDDIRSQDAGRNVVKNVNIAIGEMGNALLLVRLLSKFYDVFTVAKNNHHLQTVNNTSLPTCDFLQCKYCTTVFTCMLALGHHFVNIG